METEGRGGGIHTNNTNTKDKICHQSLMAREHNHIPRRNWETEENFGNCKQVSPEKFLLANFYMKHASLTTSHLHYQPHCHTGSMGRIYRSFGHFLFITILLISCDLCITKFHLGIPGRGWVVGGKQHNIETKTRNRNDSF